LGAVIANDRDTNEASLNNKLK